MPGFALRFALACALLLGLLEYARDGAAERAFVERLLVLPAAALVRAFPGEPADAVARSLVSASARVNVVRGCDGLDAMLLYAAAVLAFPAPLRSRLPALALGALAIHAASVARLAAAYLIVRDAPAWFGVVHGLIAPLAVVLAGALVFGAWLARMTPAR